MYTPFMAIPVPDGTLFLDFMWSGTAIPNGALNRFGLSKAGYAGDFAALVADVRTNWIESLQPWTSSAANLTIRVSEGAGGGLTPRADSASVSGTVAGDALPPNVCYLVHKRTDVGGRHGKGRLFYPGVPETVSGTGGVLTSTAVAGVPAAFSLFLQKCTADSIQLRITAATNSWTSYPITALDCSQKFSTQRRRLRR